MPSSFSPQDFQFGSDQFGSGPLISLSPSPTTGSGGSFVDVTPDKMNWNTPGKSSLMDIGNLAIGGLQTLGSLWAAFQQLGLAKKQFNFTKDFANANLANQIQSYNTSLSDRARARGVMEGQSAAQTQAYVDQNKLASRTVGS